ncbi:hypothetical protein EJB05_39453, partial [Eragrostis curvula]
MLYDIIGNEPMKEISATNEKYPLLAREWARDLGRSLSISCYHPVYLLLPQSWRPRSEPSLPPDSLSPPIRALYRSLLPLLGAHEVSKGSSRASTIILGLVFLEVTAFYGVYLNLVVYLQDVLHGDSASNAATVNFWAAASYLMPVVGVAIADSYWGKYKTVLVGLSTALVGMVVMTTSATVPSLRPPPCEQSTDCTPASLSQRLVFFTGGYLCAIGIGAAKAAIASFGAEQFDDDEREQKASYFSWYYGVGGLGALTAGTLLVWIQDRVSWGLGFGVCASFLAAAVIGLAATAPVYRLVPPAGSPLKGVCQVLVAFAHKVNVSVPADAAELYEEEHVKTPLLEPAARGERLDHTDEFRCLDKAAVVTAADREGGGDSHSWRLCTVTKVEELKTLLRLIPIWLTSAVYFVANSQSETTFVQQGTMTDPKILGGAVFVPAASLSSVQTVFVIASVALYNRAAAPAARRFLGRAEAFSPLQLMGLGHAAGAVAVAAAAYAEAGRLGAAAAGAPPISIAWLLPQYVAMAVSDASLSVGQLEFFYDQAPETMRGASTAFYFLSVSLGNLLSSQLVKLVASVTAAGGRKGWFPPDMDDGHLDYYYLLIVAITAPPCCPPSLALRLEADSVEGSILGHPPALPVAPKGRIAGARVLAAFLLSSPQDPYNPVVLFVAIGTKCLCAARLKLLRRSSTTPTLRSSRAALCSSLTNCTCSKLHELKWGLVNATIILRVADGELGWLKLRMDVMGRCVVM